MRHKWIGNLVIASTLVMSSPASVMRLLNPPYLLESDSQGFVKANLAFSSASWLNKSGYLSIILFVNSEKKNTAPNAMSAVSLVLK